MDNENKFTKFINEIYNINTLKIFSFKQLIIILTIAYANGLLNQIILKVNGIGKFPVIYSKYSFKPDIYYLNNETVPKKFVGSNIEFTQSENEVILVFNIIVGNCTLMFKGCSKITEIDLSNFKSPNKGNIDSMFQGCTSLKNIKFGNFQTSKINNMNLVFSQCSSLKSLDLSNFNTAKVTHFHYMFNGCTSLKYLDLSNFDGSSAICVNNMFNGCTSITSINLSNFVTSKITLIYNVFYNGKNLISLDLYSFALNKAPKSEYIKNTFYGCKLLEFINFKKIVLLSTNLKIYEDMIKNAKKSIVFCFDEFKTISNQTNIHKNCSLKIYNCSNSKEKSKKMISGSNICVDSCSISTFIYEYSGKCYSECPYGTIENNFICYDSLELGKCGDIKPTDFKNQVKEKITSYTNSSFIINGSNFKAAVISSDKLNPEEQIKNGISAFDLGNCTNILKEYYEIPYEENLIILNMEIKNEKNESDKINDKSFDLGKNTQIEIYDNSGRKLNLSVCKEDIKIFKYIGDVEEIDIDSAKTLSNQGVDVFNIEDDFFNDICHQYNSSENKDIILNDRRNDIYKNVSFCQNGCIYKGMDYNLMAANCICDSTFSQEKKINNITNSNKIIKEVGFKNLINILITNLFNFNLGVLRCYNLMSNTKILVKNIGFYSLFLMFVLQIIFFIEYLIKQLNPIKNFMISLNNKNKKIKKSIQNKMNIIFINNKNVKKNNKNKIKKHKHKVSPPKKSINAINIHRIISNKKRKINLMKSHSNNYSSKNSFSSSNNSQNINIYNQNNLKEINNDIKDDKIELFKNEKNIKKNNNLIDNLNSNKKLNDLNQGLENNHNNKQFCENKNEIIKLLKNISNMHNINYEEAILYDKREYLKMYWGFLVEQQIIFGTFCTDNHLDLFIIKLSFFVFNFQISFFLNAFFYTDEYISNAYHNDGVLNFISGLPKSIYSFVVTLIITNLLRIFYSSKNELLRLIIEKLSNKCYTDLIQIKLDKLSKKLIVYFIIMFLFSILFLYYTSAFCASFNAYISK